MATRVFCLFKQIRVAHSLSQVSRMFFPNPASKSGPVLPLPIKYFFSTELEDSKDKEKEISVMQNDLVILFRNAKYQEALVVAKKCKEKVISSSFSFFFFVNEQFRVKFTFYLQISEVFGENHPVYASILSNLGLISKENGDKDSAESYYIEVSFFVFVFSTVISIQLVFCL